jgi:hypothetical protein
LLFFRIQFGLYQGFEIELAILTQVLFAYPNGELACVFSDIFGEEG